MRIVWFGDNGMLIDILWTGDILNLEGIIYVIVLKEIGFNGIEFCDILCMFQ